MKTKNLNSNIYEKYSALELSKFDIVVDKKVFHLYNNDTPKIGDFISQISDSVKIIYEVVDDGETYFIKTR